MRQGFVVIRIMVVADLALFRRALAQALAREHDIDVVGDYDRAGGLDGTAADVAVVDLDSPQNLFPSELPACPVVVLTTGRGSLRKSSRSWVRGVVDKDHGMGHLVHAVRRAAAGEPFLPVDRQKSKFSSPLTDREMDVLRLAAEGLPAAEIARGLRLTPGTVRNYLSAVIRKTGARNRLEAILAADRAGWL
jgi:two-component system response regulator DesR